MTCCGAVPTTPLSCCTASSGQWCRSSWARSSCSWRCAPVPSPSGQRPFRRGSAPTRFAKTCPAYPQIAVATRLGTRSRRTLTPSCRRRHGPCRCLRCRCDAAIENIRIKQIRCFCVEKSYFLGRWQAGGRSRSTECGGHRRPTAVWCGLRDQINEGGVGKRTRGKPAALPVDFSRNNVEKRQHFSSGFNCTKRIGEESQTLPSWILWL